MGIAGRLSTRRLRHVVTLTFFSLTALSTARADEIRVLTGNAVQGPQKALAEQFKTKTGHTVVITSANPSVIQQKLDADEPFELYVIPAAFLKTQADAGKLQPGARPLAKIGVGVAAREGGPTPDLGSAEAFKKSLLAAKAVTYSDASTGGLSALSVAKVLANLGLTEAIKAKTVMSTNGQELVAKGDADYGLYNASEIPRAKGVVLAGRVPASVQATLDYDAGIPKTNAKPDAARAFLAFMASAEAFDTWEVAHIDQAKP
jgi:molybdate transport system substrate-binding protein